MDRGAWWAMVHGVAKSPTWLNLKAGGVLVSKIKYSSQLHEYLNLDLDLHWSHSSCAWRPCPTLHLLVPASLYPRTMKTIMTIFSIVIESALGTFLLEERVLVAQWCVPSDLVLSMIWNHSYNMKAYLRLIQGTHTLHLLSSSVFIYLYFQWCSQSNHFFYVNPVFISLNLLQYYFCLTIFWLQGMWIPDPWPGIKPTAPALEGKVMTSGPPGKALQCHLDMAVH